MRGDFDEDELDDDDPFDWGLADEDVDDICTDCGKRIGGEDVCGVCGGAMCFACFEMGAGVCKGPHK